MSQSRRPPMGAMPTMGAGYPQQGGPYMGQQMPPMGPGPGGPQRFMMGGQMPNHMYPSQPNMYQMPQQHPGPPVSPANRPPTPQQSQIQQMQNMVTNSPKNPSPSPSVSSDHGSTHSIKQEDGLDIKMEQNLEDGAPRPGPSPVGSTGSRSNTPASIPGGQAGSPMPVRPSPGQVDGSNRMTQSPMATQGYNQQMMPPPNSMGYMPGSGKMGGQMPGHYPQYNAQYPQGQYPRQQPGMPGMGPGGPMSGGPMSGGPMSGGPMSGGMQQYPGSQPNMYPNGPQMGPGGPMYGGMPGMNRNMPQPGYGNVPFSQGPGGMVNQQYPGYSPHMGPMPGQHPGMPPQQPGQMPPGSTSGPLPPNMGSQPSMMPQHNSSNKAAAAAHAAMMAAASSTGPRGPRGSSGSTSGSTSPSRGMFQQSGPNGGGPLAQMNNMTNSPNFGSPSLAGLSNAVEQLGRGSAPPASTPSPVPKSSPHPSQPSSIARGEQSSPHTDPAEPSSRPSSATTHPPDLHQAGDTTSSDGSSGGPSDSTSVDSGFHSSDQGDKTDSSSTPTQSVPSPSTGQTNGEANSRTLENISPPSQQTSHIPSPVQNHPHMGMDSHNKMPYSSDGVPLPPSSVSSNAMSSMPSSVVTTVVTGPSSTAVTQSIGSPVTCVASSMPHHPHPLQQQHMGPHGPHPGPHGGPPHPMMSHMGPGGHPGGPMPNGMPPSGMMGPGGHPGHMGGPGQQMPPHNMPMMPGMGGPNMNMNQNGPMMGPNGPMMGHNGPMMQGPPGMNNGGPMHPMGNMPPHHQQPMNNMPGNNGPPEEAPPPEKKKKAAKDMDRMSYGFGPNQAGAHYLEEPNSPGGLKSTSDLSKLYELGPEPDRRAFIERVLAFLEESGNPVTALPVISKTPLDVYKLYYSVKEKGGFEEVTRGKKWREICQVVNIGTSASAAFTLKKNYIRYLFNFECKFDRGGTNPAPILAAMEATLAQKREAKNKTRAPSPGSTNSNDAFRPPSAPNNQMDSGFPPNMPPPYMQNSDGSPMGNPHMSGGQMMMPNNMMGGPPHHGNMGPMMGGPQGMGPQGMGPQGMGPQGMGPPGMMGGPGMMPGQQGMMPNQMGGPPMMGGPQGGPPGYGGQMMPQHPPGQGPQAPSANGPVPPTGAPVTSDSVSVQDPFSDESSYRRGPQVTPPPTSQMPTSGPPGGQGYPGTQQSSMGSGTVTSSASRPPSSGAGDAPMSGGFPNSSTPQGSGPFPGPYGQQFDRPDRFDQSSPNMRPPGPGMGPGPQGPPQSGDNSGPMYPGGHPGARFPGPQGPMMRPPGPDGPGQYQQGPPYQGQGPYPNYPQNSGPYPGPRPPYGTPGKRFPDEHGPDPMGGQWSPHQRRMQQGSQPYMPPAPPSTPPTMFSRAGSHRNSPQSRERFGSSKGQQQKVNYGPSGPNMSKKELNFPTDCVEGVSISTTKRRKMTSKDLAPFEAWRLMLALKSGLLAESTWALDTMNILLHDDATYGYFSLATLPGLLEVLSEHFRQCLIQMFDGFSELEPESTRRRINHKKNYKSLEELTELPEDFINADGKVEPTRMFNITGTNFTNMSRKGLPVKFDDTNADPSVMDSKNWDIYSHFGTKPDHFSAGGGDFTGHIVTHLESSNTNSFLSGRFRKKRTWGCVKDEGEEKDNDEITKRVRIIEELNSARGCGAKDSLSEVGNVNRCKSEGDTKSKTANNSNTDTNHSSVCNGVDNKDGSSLQVKLEVQDDSYNKSEVNRGSETKSSDPIVNCEHKNKEIKSDVELTKSQQLKEEKRGTEKSISDLTNKPLENGDIEEPKLSPMVNCEKENGTHVTKTETKEKSDGDRKEVENDCSSPPVLKAECLDERMDVDRKTESVHNQEKRQADTQELMESEDDKKPLVCLNVDIKTESNEAALDSSLDETIYITETETEKLSASIVSEMLKEDEHIEDEAFQRDDPPLTVTSASRDELGRRCVCISNIIRSLTYVPGNELKLTKHAGIMRLLGRLLLLHHSHPRRPEPRTLPREDHEDEEREEPPRVYDNEHWWWDYLDQLRENVLVTLANIAPHLMLGGFPEPVVRPLLEGLMHWVVCPASVARDPMPTLPAGSALCPQKLGLEALCKLCIQEENVDLVLAIRPVKRQLELYKILVHHLADRQQPIQREFSIVLLSFLVPGDTSAARAVALQNPCVSLLIDFLEAAEQSALSIANSQGVEVLQSNPEVMGTSLDMLRRSASILLHMARVPDNRKLFTAQQPRLLNLVMSQILDQTVSNTLSEVLFECSQFS